ncbi:MAG: hypothetical protein JXL81_08985 [Deltaproteobacteria bacterium]|nr:hypothetical protein [Deltaproteobacteria bacterium]
MKNFPFKILFLCIFLPPVLYVFTLNGLEIYLSKKAEIKIESIIIQNNDELLKGKHSIREEINRNIGNYLKGKSFWYDLGINTDIIIKTKNNRVLYPAELIENKDEFQYGTPGYPNYIDVAAENYKILEDGLVKDIEVRIRQNSWLANGILVCYIVVALLILRFFIKKGIKLNEEKEKEQIKKIEELTNKLLSYESELSNIKDKERNYSESIEKLNQEKKTLSSDIDELLEEMERLEKGLKTQQELREKRENEIHSLKTEIEDIRLKYEKPRKKSKKQETVDKRFRVLYKNLIFTEKAIDGFLSLSDEFQLKAEEIIHRINEDDSTVNIRRKVFSKGGKINVLEVEFAYSGRIYYQKDKTKSIIAVIGTKKTQPQDLAYLEREYN